MGNSAPPWPTPRRQSGGTPRRQHRRRRRGQLPRRQYRRAVNLGELRAGIRVQLAPVAPARAVNTGAAVNLGELRAAVANSAPPIPPPPSTWGNSAPARAGYTGAVNLGELRAAGKDGELRAVNTGAAAVANSAPSIPPPPSIWGNSAPARAGYTGAVNLGELRAAGKDGELRAVNTGAAAVANSAPSIPPGGTPRGNPGAVSPSCAGPRRQHRRRRQSAGTPRRRQHRRRQHRRRRRGQLRAANTAAAVNLGELRAGYAARDCFTAAVANSAPSTPAPPPWPTPRRQYRRRRQSGGTPRGNPGAVSPSCAGPRRQHRRRRQSGGTPRRRQRWGTPRRRGQLRAVNLGELRAVNTGAAAVANSAPSIPPAPSTWGNSAPDTPRGIALPPPWPTSAPPIPARRQPGGTPRGNPGAVSPSCAGPRRQHRRRRQSGGTPRRRGQLRAANTAAAVNLGELRAGPRRIHRRRQPGGTPRRIRRAGLLYRRRGQLRAANTAAPSTWGNSARESGCS